MSIRKTILDAARPVVHLTIPQELADALAVYLDEEEVFDEVVELLLKAIPEPEPVEEVVQRQGWHWLDARSRRWDHLHQRREGDDGDPLRMMKQRHPDIFNMKGAVFQFTIKPDEDAPRVEGWNDYTNTPHEKGRFWFDNHLDQIATGAKIVGYWHPLTDTFRSDNRDMVAYLVKNGYIEP